MDFKTQAIPASGLAGVAADALAVIVHDAAVPSSLEKPIVLMITSRFIPAVKSQGGASATPSATSKTQPRSREPFPDARLIYSQAAGTIQCDLQMRG